MSRALSSESGIPLQGFRGCQGAGVSEALRKKLLAIVLSTATQSNTMREAERKRLARQRTSELFKELEELMDLQSHVLTKHGIQIEGKGQAVSFS